MLVFFGCMYLVFVMDEFLLCYFDLNIDFWFSDSILDVVEGGFDVVIWNVEFKDLNLYVRKFVEDKWVIVVLFDYIKKYGEFSSIYEFKNYVVVNLMGLEIWEFKMF